MSPAARGRVRPTAEASGQWRPDFPVAMRMRRQLLLLLASCAGATAGSDPPPAPGAPNSTAVVAPLAGPFTDVSTVSAIEGLVAARGSTLAPVPGGLTSPSNDSVALLTTLLPNGTYELFMLEGKANATDRTVRRYLSADLKLYTASPSEPVLPPAPLLGAAMAKATTAADGYLLMVFRPSASAAAGANSSSAAAFTFTSPDGCTFTASSTAPAFVDYPAAGLLHHPTLGWLDFQTTLQQLPDPKPFPDAVGARHRRVLSVHSLAARSTHWTALADDGLLLLPDTQDPPELEFLSMHPFWYGSRICGVVANYVPSPCTVGGPAVNNTAVDDLPVMSQEWWVSNSSGGGSTAWLRPYQLQSQFPGTTSAVTGGNSAAPPGFVITHAPLSVPQTITSIVAADAHMWLGSGPFAGQWWGLMLHRIGGTSCASNNPTNHRPA
jgi:hypothetical protein